MSYTIAVLSQKGGVGKSTLAQLVAQGYAANEYSVLLADMDAGQSSSVKWGAMRLNSAIQPAIEVKSFRTVAAVQHVAENYDLVVFDGAPQASAQTLEIARQADLILLPSNTSKFDMDPQISLAHELVAKGVSASRIYFVLSRIVSTEKDLQAAFDYIGQTPYRVMTAVLEEKTGYRAAAEQGKSLTETTIPTLKARCEALFGNVSAALMKIISYKKVTI